MRVDDLRAEGGERSVRVRWDGGEGRLRTSVPPELAVADADLTQFVPVTLMVAMRRAEPLELDGPVSGRLLDSLGLVQEILSAFGPTLTRVPVRVAERAAPPDGRAPARGCCFSRGVDSMYSAAVPRRAGRELTHLVYCDGFDPSYGPATSRARIDAAREAADRIGLPLVLVGTNMTELIDQVVDFEDVFGAGLAMVGHSLAGGLGSLTLPSARDYASSIPMGSHPLLDPRWSSERVEIAHDSLVLDRPGKVRWLVEHRPDLVERIHTCWETDTAANCGECSKCLSTMVMLEIAGGLREAGSFPPQLELERIRDWALPSFVARLGINDAHRAIPPGPEYDGLRAAVEQALRRGAELPLGDGVHGIWLHQSRLFASVAAGLPCPTVASGPREPEPEVGPLPPARRRWWRRLRSAATPGSRA